MRFELSIRGIDTSSLKYDNEKETKLSPEEEKTHDRGLKEAMERKAREHGR